MCLSRAVMLSAALPLLAGSVLTVSAQEPDPPAGGDRLVVFSADGALRLALTDTELRLRFTDDGIRKVRDEVRENLEDDGGPLAHWIRGVVETTVFETLAHLRVAVDVCAVTEARLDDRHIAFRYGHGGTRGSHSRIGPFRRDDARRLLEALETVQARRCGLPA